MSALHTLGVVNANATGGKAVLKELKNLTQLLKLSVCGINPENWQDLCNTISGYCHLESLSVRFDEDCLDDRFNPPNTLKSLKLHGPIHEFPFWINDHGNLEKLYLEITISKQNDVYFLAALPVPDNGILLRLCIRPTQQVHELEFNLPGYHHDELFFRPRVHKIDCSSELEVTFANGIVDFVEVLTIHCSRGSSFRVSENGGLGPLGRLRTVWLKGSYSEADREHLKRHVDSHYNRPALKLEQARSSS